MATLSECEREAAPAHERLLAAVSAADALPRGTAFEKVKGARDRLRGNSPPRSARTETSW